MTITKKGVVLMMDHALRQCHVRMFQADGFVLAEGRAWATMDDGVDDFVVHMEFLVPKVGLAHRLTVFNPHGAGAWFEHTFADPMPVGAESVLAFHFVIPWEAPSVVASMSTDEITP